MYLQDDKTPSVQKLELGTIMVIFINFSFLLYNTSSKYTL